MKKKILLLAALLLATPLSYAQLAKGVIEEVRMCGNSNEGAVRLARTLQFKVDGSWFALYSDFSGWHKNNFEHDDSITTSLIMTAYFQQAVVEVNATKAWSSELSACGASSSGNLFHDNPGDYIRLSNQFLRSNSSANTF